MAATGYELDADIQTSGPQQRTRGVLTSAAQDIPQDDQGRWRLGVKWQPWGTGFISTVAADCDTVYNKTARTLPSVVTQPAFWLYDSITCSTLGYSFDLLAGRVSRSMEVYTSAALAAELETGTASGGVGLVGDATYQPTVAAAGGRPLARALNDLEQHLADALHGAVGMIHLTPGLLGIAVGEGLVEWRDGQYRTASDHVVVGDAGHSGTATPYGQSAGSVNSPWIYATSMVAYAVSETQFAGNPEGNSEVYIGHNDNRPLAERFGLLVFDPNTIGAARVSIAASDGDGGDGGTGASTITPQAIAGGDITADTVHGWSLYNSDASDAALIYIRFGTEADSTPFIPVALAAGESVTFWDDDGMPVSAGVVHITNEGAADITDVVGTIFTGTA